MLAKYPLYPILFAVFSAVFLGANNIRQIPLSANIRPLIICLLLGLVVYGITRVFLKDWHLAALVALLILIMFFAYGQIYLLLLNNPMNARGTPLHHSSFLPWYLLSFVVILYFVIRKSRNASVYTFWLNNISIFLLIHPAFSLIVAVYQHWSIDHYSGETVASVTNKTDTPDIYYMVLDAYGREDILLNELGYDNNDFLNALRERGFYVADCSQSNYAYTDLTLTSTLNFDYLDTLVADNSFERMRILKHSSLRTFLEMSGYKVAAFSTGWVFTEWQDADWYFDYPHSPGDVTEYEIFLMDTTLLRSMENLELFSRPGKALNTPRRLRALNLLSKLGTLNELDGRVFVYAHLMLPHPPYSFSADGSPSDFQEERATRQSVINAYVDQVKFVNAEMLRVIDEILAGSEQPPVIIIQGDHGPPPELSPTYREKMPILNAYYLPGLQADQELYPGISPVNSFRVVLNSYFDQDFPLLEDKSYYSPPDAPEAYELVPGSCP